MDLNPNRIQLLSEIIDSTYGHITTEDLDDLSANFPYVVTDLYEVTRITNKYIVLMSIMSDDLIYPVYLDPAVRFSLKKQDVFLLTLGLKDFDWHVLHMGPPYEVEEVYRF